MCVRSSLNNILAVLGFFFSSILLNGAVRIDRTIPPVLLLGKTNSLTLQGKNLPDLLSLHSLDSYIPLPTHPSKSSELSVVAPPHFPIGLLPIWFTTPKGLTLPQILLFDNLPTETIHLPTPSTLRSTPTSLSLPSGTYAQLSELEYHYYLWQPPNPLETNSSVTFEIFAQRLGANTDPVLKIYKNNGTEIRQIDDSPGYHSDLIATLQPEPGISYLLEIRDIEYRGGPDYFYYLRATSNSESLPLPTLQPNEIEPNNTPTEASPSLLSDPHHIIGTFHQDRDADWFRIEIPSAPTTLALHSDSRRYQSPIDLRLLLQNQQGQPLGNPKIEDAWDDYWTFSIPQAGTYHLKVENLTQRHSDGFPYHIALQLPAPGYQLFVPNLLIEAAPGGKTDLPYTLERQGYEDPIELKIKGLPPGSTYSDALVSSKSKEGKLSIQLPDNLKPGAFYPLELQGFQTHSPTHAPATQASTIRAWNSIYPNLPFPPTQHLATFYLNILPR